MTICVIGTGTMGCGIVQVFAQSGFPVIMKGISVNETSKGMALLEKNFSRLVEKGKISQQEKEEMLAKISPVVDVKECAAADVVIEAIFENMDSKREIFTQLDSVCKPDTIFASNTSSLSVTEIASSTKRAGNFIGMHFFNPAPVMKLVEIIRGQLTTDECTSKITELAKKAGKTPVLVNEAPGFVVNRILIPLVNEGIGILADGVVTKEEIDAAMKLGANHPMGPLELGDLIGLDVCLAIMEVLYSEFGDSKYRPHPLLRKMVRANLLGRKTGEGFYKY